MDGRSGRCNSIWIVWTECLVDSLERLYTCIIVLLYNFSNCLSVGSCGFLCRLIRLAWNSTKNRFLIESSVTVATGAVVAVLWRQIAFHSCVVHRLDESWTGGSDLDGKDFCDINWQEETRSQSDGLGILKDVWWPQELPCKTVTLYFIMDISMYCIVDKGIGQGSSSTAWKWRQKQLMWLRKLARLQCARLVPTRNERTQWDSGVRSQPLQSHVEVNMADILCRLNFYFLMSSNNIWICLWSKILCQGNYRGRCSYSSKCFVSWLSDLPYLYQMLWWRKPLFTGMLGILQWTWKILLFGTFGSSADWHLLVWRGLQWFSDAWIQRLAAGLISVAGGFAISRLFQQRSKGDNSRCIFCVIATLG